jgi:hypothetical protein
MSDQTKARSMIVYGYCSSTSGAFSGILLTKRGEYVGCTSSSIEADLPAALLDLLHPAHAHGFLFVPRSQVPTHAGLQRAIAAYMGPPDFCG